MSTCVLHGVSECDLGVIGRLVRHHVVKQQIIKRKLSGEHRERALGDPRNTIDICDRHHHRITHGWDRDELANQFLAGKLDDLMAFVEDFPELRPDLDRELLLYGLTVMRIGDG